MASVHNTDNNKHSSNHLYNMLGSTALTNQANNIINHINNINNIIYVHEDYVWGEVYENGPTDNNWALYLVIQNEDGTRTNLLYYRYLYIEDHSINLDSIDSEYQQVDSTNNHVFEIIHLNL